MAAALWALLHDPGVTPQPRPIVTVAMQPQPDPGSCTEPMVLTATITVDRATKLDTTGSRRPARGSPPNDR